MPGGVTTHGNKRIEAPPGQVVPRIVHSVSAGASGYVQQSVALTNPSFRFHHLNDSEAHEYVRRNVGIAAAKAYRCLNAPAWCGFSSGLVSADELSRSLCLSRRADLFRFAALFADGGVYLDADIVLLH